jgi:hypothetical protein
MQLKKKEKKHEIGLAYGVKRHFQQYRSYIVAVNFIGGGNEVPGENHRPVASHCQTRNRKQCS